jgi:hypothetical protein
VVITVVKSKPSLPYAGSTWGNGGVKPENIWRTGYWRVYGYAGLDIPHFAIVMQREYK